MKGADRRIVRHSITPLALAASGLAMLVLAVATPWYSDADAYFAAIAGLPVTEDLDAASKAFHAAQDRYATRKWLYADIGYGLLAWSVLAALIGAIAWRWGWGSFLRTRTHALGLALLGLFGTIALAVGFLGMAFHPYLRKQIPWWADSLGIPISEVEMALPRWLAIILVLGLAPLVFRPAPRTPLLVVSRRPHWATVLITLIYAGPIALCGLMLASSFSPGGWALSGAGLALGWLSLNARALAIGARADPRRETGSTSGYPAGKA